MLISNSKHEKELYEQWRELTSKYIELNIEYIEFKMKVMYILEKLGVSFIEVR